MADINVEHKKKAVWPWIIAAIVAILVIWALIQLFDDDDAEGVIAPAAQSSSMPVPFEPAASAIAYRTRDAVDSDFA